MTEPLPTPQLEPERSSIPFVLFYGTVIIAISIAVNGAWLAALGMIFALLCGFVLALALMANPLSKGRKR